MKYILLVIVLVISGCMGGAHKCYEGYDKYTYAKLLILQRNALKQETFEPDLSYIEAMSKEVGTKYSPFNYTILQYCCAYGLDMRDAEDIDIDFDKDGTKEKVVMFFDEASYPGRPMKLDWLTEGIGMECYGFVIFWGKDGDEVPIFSHYFNNFPAPVPVKLVKQEDAYVLIYTLDGRKYKSGWFSRGNGKGYWDGICEDAHGKCIYNNCFIKLHGQRSMEQDKD